MQFREHSQLVTLLALPEVRHRGVQRKHDPKQETGKRERERDHEQQQYQGGCRFELEFNDSNSIQN